MNWPKWHFWGGRRQEFGKGCFRSIINGCHKLRWPESPKCYATFQSSSVSRGTLADYHRCRKIDCHWSGHPDLPYVPRENPLPRASREVFEGSNTLLFVLWYLLPTRRPFSEWDFLKFADSHVRAWIEHRLLNSWSRSADLEESFRLYIWPRQNVG